MTACNNKKEQASASAAIETTATASIILTMETKPKNDNDCVVEGTGTATGTGPSPPPLDGTTDNNNNNDEVITAPPMMLTGSDVAAICKLVIQPINDVERQFSHTLKAYIAEQGGSDTILQRCSEGGGGGQDHKNSGFDKAGRAGTDVNDDSANNTRTGLSHEGEQPPASNKTDDGKSAAVVSTEVFAVAGIHKKLSEEKEELYSENPIQYSVNDIVIVKDLEEEGYTIGKVARFSKLLRGCYCYSCCCMFGHSVKFSPHTHYLQFFRDTIIKFRCKNLKNESRWYVRYAAYFIWTKAKIC